MRSIVQRKVWPLPGRACLSGNSNVKSNLTALLNKEAASGAGHRHATSPGQAWQRPETMESESSFEVFLHSLIFLLTDFTTCITPVENFFCTFLPVMGPHPARKVQKKFSTGVMHVVKTVKRNN